MSDQPITIKQSGTITVTTQIPSWVWRCELCGWLGTGHTSDHAALREAADHCWTDHKLAICAPIEGEKQYGHPGHQWHHVKGSDSVDQWDRCKDMIEK